ncbi:hypothetical protein A3Q56_00012 [Intoshia linei]|uniref:39S ribosomal protein L27, mitochondrial n=1 Tax=Intoshia linei TaxID=1819745 RepID=A0A177BD24_9BILA|nr:hypothetical protein A3Q56_00012 [Intoshia linei]
MNSLVKLCKTLHSTSFSKILFRTITKNKKPSCDKQRGQKLIDNEWAEKDTILVTQLKLHYYPGDNVGCSRDYTLYALESGRVLITSELLKPKIDSKLYIVMKKGKEFHRYFYHIIPEKQNTKFKLIDEI